MNVHSERSSVSSPLSVVRSACLNRAVTALDLALAADRLSPVIERMLAEHPSLPSAAVALLGPDGQRVEVVRGFADRAAGEPLTSEHTYRIASCTKPFVAATVVSLAAEGAVVLDAPVIEFVAPAVADLFGRYEHARVVTVRQVLQHRSGLVDHSLFPEFNASITAQWSPLQQIAIAVGKPALFAPGTAMSYSDSGYVLLGQMIEHLTGESLAAAVRVRAAIDAATMPSMHWEVAEPTPVGAPRAHQWFEGNDSYGWNPSFDLFGGGGLVSTLADLARWWSNWFTGVHGHIATHLADPAPTLGPDGTQFPGGDRVGLGLFGHSLGDVQVWSHGGFWGLETGYVPHLGVAYALSLTHRAPTLPGPLLLADSVLGALVGEG
jgi:D-alanyl-D-alanine carboxypeptidase